MDTFDVHCALPYNRCWDNEPQNRPSMNELRVKLEKLCEVCVCVHVLPSVSVLAVLSYRSLCIMCVCVIERQYDHVDHIVLCVYVCILYSMWMKPSLWYQSVSRNRRRRSQVRETCLPTRDTAHSTKIQTTRRRWRAKVEAAVGRER